MNSLVIEKMRNNGTSTTPHKITGFAEGELQRLKNLPHAEAKDMLILMLDERNYGQGHAWACGEGIYGLWFDNEAAYLNIGNSCD